MNSLSSPFLSPLISMVTAPTRRYSFDSTLRGILKKIIKELPQLPPLNHCLIRELGWLVIVIIDDQSGHTKHVSLGFISEITRVNLLFASNVILVRHIRDVSSYWSRRLRKVKEKVGQVMINLWNKWQDKLRKHDYFANHHIILLIIYY